MNTQTVEITATGIRKILNKYSPERAISEYIWNGFDAKATIVSINFEVDSEELDIFKSIRILDNGTGICFEKLSENFKKFYESQKAIIKDSTSGLTRGKNGYGRFTFHKFARFAKWETSYFKEDHIESYEINISNDNLKDYTSTVPVACNGKTGTCVVFEDISTDISNSFIESTLKPYLKAEFAWFLELKDEYKIYINEVELDYSSIIAETDNFPINVKNKNGQDLLFDCKYIRWSRKINDEYSRFYFLNTELELKNTKTTLLNKKGDGFWHSIIVVNNFFNDINSDSEEEDNNGQSTLFDNAENRKIFRDLVTDVNEYLKNKRKPFLKQQADVLINKYEDEKVFPIFGDNDWDKARKQGLADFIKGLYEVEPSVFMKLNKEQKKVFLELLNLIMDSGEQDSLFKIIEAVVDLNSNERKEFAKILETTRLKQVISTIKLISDRLLVLENLKKLVFNHELKAGEVKHLQKFIEKHYWVFGEEYRLVCSEEVKFEEALRKYIYILRGVDKKTFIAHPDKYKEMDLFLAGTDFRDGKPHNIVVEIKNPTTIKKITSDEVTQIKKYIDVILNVDMFNDSNEFWSFYLIGQDYDDIVGSDILNLENGLLRKRDHHCLYVKKWSEIINDIERRLKYLLEKLQIERTKLSTENTLECVMAEVVNNSAVLVPSIY